MTVPLQLLVCMTVFTWVVLMLASLAKARAWTPRGMLLAFGNRADMPEPSAAAARLDRAARNTLENFLLFAALVLAADAAHVDTPLVTLGAQLFAGSRIAFVLVYWAGIPYLRTAVWTVGVVGMGLIAAAMLGR
ncbi:MAG TPA: MAPEG family protein [Ideonella sp.]|uniref:MAPEG family protein n=1 Tax=Ideonella sp. TaxID=1929293 RepID=UPI002E370BFD|nr:MAPEG family protein [Ideonella sp.]HEX5682570.1 MAPEG family protein [Ideonella sp.]